MVVLSSLVGVPDILDARSAVSAQRRLQLGTLCKHPAREKQHISTNLLGQKFPEFFFEFSSRISLRISLRIFRGFFVLRFVGNGDQKKITQNPCHFSMQNSQANTEKIFTKCFWRAGKATNNSTQSVRDG